MSRLKVVSVGLITVGSLWLGSCTNVTEERITKLEERITLLESGTALQTQSVSFNESKGVSEPTSSIGAATAVAFAETTHEFGTIAEGDVVEHTFVFTNTGDNPLVVIDAETTCGCTVPKKPEAPIPPGETGEIQVRFNSHGKTGINNKAVTITTNTEPATTRLFIKANVISEDNTTANNN